MRKYIILKMLIIFGFLYMLHPNMQVKAEEGNHALQAYERILAEDDFTNGDKWEVNQNVSFTDGAAVIQGSGPCNRMGYRAGKINADDFLIQLDLTPNEGNTNSNAKIAFKIEDQYEGDRLQVRFDFTRATDNVFIERTSNNSVTNFEKAWSESSDFTFETGKTYAVDILIKSSNIKVYIGDGENPVLEVDKEEIGAMEKGYFAIAGQFPNQDFSIDNLKISTDEEQIGEKYSVTLKVVTDGSETNPAGGTLTANVTEGYAGDTITLSAVPVRGYVFDRYESYKADGASTDGLMPITNNMFTLDSKFGSVTVVAHFKTREAGRFELFYDDFISGAFDSSYTIKDEASIVHQDGEVTFGVTGDNNYLLLKPDIFQELKMGEGYRISLDIRKEDSTEGISQLMFKGTDDSIDGRYVLSLDGTKASVIHILGNDQTVLKTADFLFGTIKQHMELEIKGSRITFYADNREVLSYDTADGWSGSANVVGLINLAKDASVVFDNLLVERILPDINVKVMLAENDGLTEDTEGVCGTVSLSTYTAAEGDDVYLTAIEKAGYRLKEYRAEDSDLGIAITNGSFTVPANITGDICIVAVFEAVSLQDGRDYYIDSAAGDDTSDGTADAPWKSFAPLKGSGFTLQPGSHIYLKRGSVFESQQFSFKGMGTKEKPIVVDAYGEGEELPRLNGNGVIENVVSLSNQEYIEIRNLEITNTHPGYNSEFGLNTSDNTEKVLRAILVTAKNFGTVSGIHIQDCYIHDINGNLNNKLNGGIYFNIGADTSSGRLIGVPTKYDDVLIEGCTFLRVDRSGIKAVVSSWCTQWDPNNQAQINWYPSTNVVIRGNYMEKIGGDGITARDTDGALIEYNLVKDCRYQNTGYNVAIWPFQAANTVIQYNEVSDTHSTDDGQGLDCDHASSYSLMQYNYSHNNEGGFMLIMGGYPHTAATIRYNVSQNDRDKTFEFAQGIPKGTMIYNNTLYSGNTVNRGVLYLSNTSAGLGVNDVYLFNNLFCYPEGQMFYGGGDQNKLPGVSKLYNNGYVGGISAPEEEGRAITEADTDSVLKAAGTVPETNNSKIPRTGFSDELNGYQLAEDSKMIDAGITMQDAIAYFGNGEADVKDNRTVSPRDLYEQAKNQNPETSIHYIMGENFPEVNGVNYGLDFFGNSNQDGTKPDIGAAETPQHTHCGGEATCILKAVCEICGLAYGEVNADNHKGETELRNEKKPTVTEYGYTGDTYCKDCGAKLAEGTVIDRLNPGKKVQVITASNVTKKSGDAPFKLNVSTNGGGAISYRSRNLSVAEIDASGIVTIKGAGIAVIEIHAEETEEYLAADLTVQITVTKEADAVISAPQKAKIKSVSNKKSGKLVVSWKKQKDADGYVVEYSGNKKFKKNVKQIIIKKNSTIKTTIKKLKKGKKYYIRIKAYKTINGRKVYGAVSKSVAKKVK